MVERQVRGDSMEPSRLPETVGISCTGGRHRSVMVAEAIKKGLTGLKGVQVRVRHRDIAID